MPFLRRRAVWLPTWPFALLLGALLAAAAFWTGRHAYDLLALRTPAPAARTLIVEGWLSRADLQQARELRRSGRYDRVLTTGGPIDPDQDVGGWRHFAARAAAILREDADSAVPVIAVPAPQTLQERTYLSAVQVRAWATKAGVTLDAVDVYTLGVHARRSRQVYRLALGDAVEVGVIAVPPSLYDGPRWWTSSDGAKNTLGEIVSLAWTSCCFWPPAAPATPPPPH
ncbi:MAG: hypothetical protein V4844_13310 [Pseudomonadota bacterium]